jgi:outer membrane beta-barrel protein
VDYRINKDKSLIFGCSNKINYPQLQQLVALNSTLDLISQTSGNIYLKPEEKKDIRVTYSTKPSSSINIDLSGEYDHYTNKFGYAINYSGSNSVQNNLTSNIGNSNAGKISFSIWKNFTRGGYLNYNNGITYQESPTLLINKLVLNNSFIFNQTLSTSLILIKSLLSFKPLIAFTYGRYFYETNSTDIITITNSDEVSVRLKTIALNLYPLFNYNHNITDNSSFSMNGELKKTVFKNYGTIWIQAYDIFNSFNFYNNHVGPSGYQSVKYSNLHRYLVVGLSLRFNNLRERQ